MIMVWTGEGSKDAEKMDGFIQLVLTCYLPSSLATK